MASPDRDIELQALSYLMTTVIHRLHENPSWWQETLKEIRVEKNALAHGAPGADVADHGWRAQLPSSSMRLPPKMRPRIRGNTVGARSMTNELIPFSSLTPAQFGGLADVPPELEWLANIPNAKTRRAYKVDLGDFSSFVGISKPEELRTVTRAHVIAWRKQLEARGLEPSSIRRKLSAPSSFI